MGGPDTAPQAPQRSEHPCSAVGAPRYSERLSQPTSLAVSANFTGTSTTLSTARGPRRAGTNVHLFTALNAALSRTREPEEAATLTSTTRPSTPTRMERT